MTTAASDLQNVYECLEIATVSCTGTMVVKVFDVQGKIAKIVRQTVENSFDKVRLNLADLCQGKYVVNIFTEDHFIKAVQYTKN